MGNSLNQVTLIGRLGQDPETRSFQDGNMIANLSVATGERWKDRNTGEMQERTEWHRVAVKRDATARFCADYLRKGDLVSVVGKLQTRKWQDQSGADRYATEIVIAGYSGEIIGLQGKDKGGSSGGGGSRSGGSSRADTANSMASTGAGGPDDIDDEIPF